MLIVSHYTESHKELLENYFLPSIKLQYNFQILTNKGNQHSVDGDYNSAGFNETTRDKIQFLLESLDRIEKFDALLFCDVDIVFFKDPTAYFKKYEQFDIVFQNGYTEFNTGFFLIKHKDKVKELLKEIVDKCHLYGNDQDAFNDLVKKTTLKYTHFDNLIACPATYNGLNVWNGEEIKITNDPIAFHACWCSGVENKKKLLTKVQSEVNSK